MGWKLPQVTLQRREGASIKKRLVQRQREESIRDPQRKRKDIEKVQRKRWVAHLAWEGKQKLPATDKQEAVLVSGQVYSLHRPQKLVRP